MLSMSINRKIKKGKYTDMVWYLENIIYKFFDIGISAEGIGESVSYLSFWADFYAGRYQFYVSDPSVLIKQ